MKLLGNVTTFRTAGAPELGRFERGIYTMTGSEGFNTLIKQRHTITASEAAAGEYQVQMKVIRYYDHGAYVGGCDPKQDVFVTKAGQSHGGHPGLEGQGEVTESGLVTVTTYLSEHWEAGDEHDIEITAKGQLPGVPIHFK
jgi:hypothetical protein